MTTTHRDFGVAAALAAGILFTLSAPAAASPVTPNHQPSADEFDCSGHGRLPLKESLVRRVRLSFFYEGKHGVRTMAPTGPLLSPRCLPSAEDEVFVGRFEKEHSKISTADKPSELSESWIFTPGDSGFAKSVRLKHFYRISLQDAMEESPSIAKFAKEHWNEQVMKELEEHTFIDGDYLDWGRGGGPNGATWIEHDYMLPQPGYLNCPRGTIHLDKKTVYEWRDGGVGAAMLPIVRVGTGCWRTADDWALSEHLVKEPQTNGMAKWAVPKKNKTFYALKSPVDGRVIFADGDDVDWSQGGGPAQDDWRLMERPPAPNLQSDDSGLKWSQTKADVLNDS
ncbi:hypothetical protein ACFWZ2_38530 [Streptomyces sp. NPDC059002]|uniref:hypothetical protein n=1 Tax=Streptomyces sp. NPDC059002 TaxID=3346690 RepID=UPI0036876982